MKPVARRFRLLHRCTPCAASLFAMAALAVGCESTGDDPDEPAGNIVLTDANNYESESTLTLPTAEVQPGDIAISWGQLTTDIQCHTLDPQDDIDLITLLRFDGLTESDIEGLLGSSELESPDIDAFFRHVADHESTSVDLSEMVVSYTKDLIDVDADFVESDELVYVLLAATGTTPGVGSRSMMFVRPTEGAPATSVEFPQGCTDDGEPEILDFQATLTDAEPVQIPSDGPWVVDWRGVKEDSLGHEIPYERLDRLLLGFYEDTTVEELQSLVKDLEQEDTYTNLWEISLNEQTSADLATAKERDGGGTFDGFDNGAEGVWLMALMCSGCQNPAPPILAVLEPTD